MNRKVGTSVEAEGWRLEAFVGHGDQMIVHAPGGLGHITVDFTVRGFRAGLTPVGRLDSTQRYTGRGWRKQLLHDAIGWLADAVGVPRPADA